MADDFIVTRTLELGGVAPGTVTVRLKRPVPDGDDYKCEFQIVGLGAEKNRYAMGIDGVQAFTLALQLVGSTLYASEECKRGELTFLGGRNLGFPVPATIAHLVPKD